MGRHPRVGVLCNAAALWSDPGPWPRDRPVEVALRGHALLGSPATKREGQAHLVLLGTFRNHVWTYTHPQT